MRRAIALVWAAPGTLAGVVLLLAARALRRGVVLHRREGTLEAHGAGVTTVLDALGALATGRFRVAALTLGHVILARDAASLEHFRAHERVHVRQWERWGALLALAYPLASAWAIARGADAYRGNRFEREAWRVGPFEG